MFHEVDYDGAKSFPPVATYDNFCKWVVESRMPTSSSRRREYGHKLNLTAGGSGLILDLVIESGNPADSECFKLSRNRRPCIRKNSNSTNNFKKLVVYGQRLREVQKPMGPLIRPRFGQPCFD